MIPVAAVMVLALITWSIVRLLGASNAHSVLQPFSVLGLSTILIGLLLLRWWINERTLKDWLANEPEPTGKERYTVTLVHGTFARYAEWILPTSLLSRRLADTFEDSAYVTRHIWSGWNLELARASAAIRLRRHLEILSRRCPTAAHYIIGHSHGGTVAAQACDPASATARVSGLVALSAPFLHIQTQPFAAAYPTGVWIHLFIGAVTIYIGLAAALFWTPPLYIDSSSVTGDLAIDWEVASITYIIPAVTIAVGYLLTLRFLVGRIRPTSVRWAKDTSVLVARTIGDEATGALVTSQFSAWLLGAIISLFERLRQGALRLGELCDMTGFDNSKRARWVVWWRDNWVGVTFGVLIAVAVASAFKLQTVALVIALPYMAVHLILCFAMCVAAGAQVIVLLTSPLQIVMGVLLLPFGADLMLTAPLLSVTAEPAPIGGPFQLVTYDCRKPVAQALSHCAAYNSELVVSAIIEFIQSGRHAALRAVDNPESSS